MTVSFWQACAFWLKLGFISFGGPAGQIAIMHSELVERRRWISEQRFLHALNYCMLLPGPEAQQLATYIGWLMHRHWGGVVAGGLFVLPSLALLILLSWLYIAFGHLPVLAGLFYGVKPAVTALVLQAALRIGGKVLKRTWLWVTAIAAFIGIFVFAVPFPVIVGVAACLGYWVGRFYPDQLVTSAGHKSKSNVTVPALIDDNTPTPAHAQWSWPRFVVVLCAGIALWIAPMAWLTWQLGWQHTFTQMAWFFTKAALLTFGGAYAVLPYVYQGAVTQFGWLNPTQMIDGLALGETTPGPLIIVVAFVGFVGAYQSTQILPLLGTDSRFLAGAIAALLVTWFTFLPSFIFIFLGGPMIESTHNNLNFTAPLTAISAAVVGVIVNLALFFAYHVFWPTGFTGRIDWAAVVICVVATLALVKFKVNVVYVIAGSALLGLFISL
jgi:chromate transporter